MLKKHLGIYSILVLCASSSVYADKTPIYKDSAPASLLSIPDLNPGLGVTLGAVWLKPGASNLNYVINNQELPAQSPAWSEQEIPMTFTPGFDLALRYVFPNSAGKDINLDWTHLNANNSSTQVADGVNFFLGPDYQIGPNGIPIRLATGNAKFNYDVVNLDVGQYLAFGSHFDMRFFGGLSTGFLRQDVTANYSGSVPAGLYAGPFSMNQDMKSNYTGIGPRFGIHADYNMDCGFGFLGEAAISALIGQQHSTTSYIGTGVELQRLYNQSINYQTIEDQNVYQVVPGIDAKLGVNYKHPFGKDGLFSVAAGYQAAVYINAISQYIPSSMVSGTTLASGGIFVATMSHTLSNYSVQGPFLNMSFQF